MDDVLLERIVRRYRDAETYILGLISEAAQKEQIGTLVFYQNQQKQIRLILSQADAHLRLLEQGIQQDVIDAVIGGYTDGVVAAASSVPNAPVPAVIPTVAVEALAAEAVTAAASQRTAILRSTEDIYRRLTERVSAQALTSGAPYNKILQASLNQYADAGISGFVDRAGRRWGMDSYAEMAVRTANNRAHNQGRKETYVDLGVDLVLTSWHRASAPQCIPYQGKILALSGRAGPRQVQDRSTGKMITVEVTATLDEAIENGYHHPNAILGGDQLIDTWGKTQAGSKGTYAGPAVTIRTAKGNSLTVSPEHPVLTSAGWRTAESVGVGDNLFRTVKSGPVPVDVVGSADLEDVETTIEEEFRSLKSGFVEVTTPASGHNFNDDRQFLQGEVHVVVPEAGLLPVPDVQIVKETGEVHFNRADMSRFDGVGNGLFDLGLHGVVPPFDIGGALPHVDSLGSETANDGHARDVIERCDVLGGHSPSVEVHNAVDVNRFAPATPDHSLLVEDSLDERPGDSNDPGTVLLAVPGDVELDEVVSVDFHWFNGHAYDFQTEDGVYAVGDLIVHNCAHFDQAYIPGMPLPEVPEVPPEEHDASQRQRGIERHIRKWKKREAVAIDPTEKLKAKQHIKAWQKAQRDHVSKHDFLVRRYEREQIRQAT